MTDIILSELESVSSEVFAQAEAVDFHSTLAYIGSEDCDPVKGEDALTNNSKTRLTKIKRKPDTLLTPRRPQPTVEEVLVDPTSMIMVFSLDSGCSPKKLLTYNVVIPPWPQNTDYNYGGQHYLVSEVESETAICNELVHMFSEGVEQGYVPELGEMMEGSFQTEAILEKENACESDASIGSVIELKYPWDLKRALTLNIDLRLQLSSAVQPEWADTGSSSLPLRLNGLCLVGQTPNIASQHSPTVLDRRCPAFDGGSEEISKCGPEALHSLGANLEQASEQSQTRKRRVCGCTARVLSKKITVCIVYEPEKYPILSTSVPLVPMAVLENKYRRNDWTGMLVKPATKRLRCKMTDELLQDVYYLRLNKDSLREILGFLAFRVELTQYVEKVVLEIFQKKIGYPLGHKRWMRDNTARQRAVFIDSLWRYTAILFPDLDQFCLEVIIRKAAYAKMQGRLRRERRRGQAVRRSK